MCKKNTRRDIALQSSKTFEKTLKTFRILKLHEVYTSQFCQVHHDSYSSFWNRIFESSNLRFVTKLPLYDHRSQESKLLILGIVVPRVIGNPYNRSVNPYSSVDDYLLQGNIGIDRPQHTLVWCNNHFPTEGLESSN